MPFFNEPRHNPASTSILSVGPCDARFCLAITSNSWQFLKQLRVDNPGL